MHELLWVICFGDGADGFSIDLGLDVAAVVHFDCGRDSFSLLRRLELERDCDTAAHGNNHGVIVE